MFYSLQFTFQIELNTQNHDVVCDTGIIDVCFHGNVYWYVCPLWHMNLENVLLYNCMTNMH